MTFEHLLHLKARFGFDFIIRDGVVAYVDSHGVEHPLTEEMQAFQPPPQVPQSITMRQCRLQLHATGKLALVDQAIASLPEPQKTEAQIEWEYGSVVWRSSSLIAMLAPVLGCDTPEAIDQLFIEAAAR